MLEGAAAPFLAYQLIAEMPHSLLLRLSSNICRLTAKVFLTKLMAWSMREPSLTAPPCPGPQLPPEAWRTDRHSASERNRKMLAASFVCTEAARETPLPGPPPPRAGTQRRGLRPGSAVLLRPRAGEA